MKLARDVGLILLLAGLWFVSAYYAGEVLLPGLGLQCGLASLITGLIGLAIINRTQAGSRLLYEGEAGDEIGCAKIAVWLLISFPFVLFVLGLVWGLMRLLGFLDLK